MTKLYDGNKAVEIEMYERDFPDYSSDFFDVSRLPYDDANGAYIVPDVDYCIDQARDWKLFQGDYNDDVVDLDGKPMDHPTEIRHVYVDSEAIEE